jgi:hypothetical protein
MRFYWDNFIDLAATTITSNAEEATLPDDNVAHEHKKKVYRCGSASTTEWIKFDLGSAKAIDGFVLLNHNFDGNESAVNIEGHASDDFSSPTFSEAVSVFSGTEVDPAFNKFSSAQTYQWWRFEFTKAVDVTQYDLGRMFLGDVYDTTEDPDSKGYKDEMVENSVVRKSIDGQTYSYIKNEYDKLQISFKAVSLAQSIQFRTMYDALGTHTPFFIQIDPTASDGVREVMRYVKFVKGLKRAVHSFSGELKWDITLQFEEQL